MCTCLACDEFEEERSIVIQYNGLHSRPTRPCSVSVSLINGTQVWAAAEDYPEIPMPFAFLVTIEHINSIIDLAESDLGTALLTTSRMQLL